MHTTHYIFLTTYILPTNLHTTHTAVKTAQCKFPWTLSKLHTEHFYNFQLRSKYLLPCYSTLLSLTLQTIKKYFQHTVGLLTVLVCLFSIFDTIKHKLHNVIIQLCPGCVFKTLSTLLHTGLNTVNCTNSTLGVFLRQCQHYFTLV